MPLIVATIDEAHDVLHRSSNLEIACFACLINLGRSMPSPPLVPIRHTQLLDLTLLTWDENVDLSELFTCLTLPNLEFLDISCFKFPFGLGFVPFLTRIEALLELNLRKSALVGEELIRALRVLPSLVALTVIPSLHTEMESLIEHLTLPNTAEGSTAEIPLLPRLENLTVGIHPLLAMSLVKLLESRCGLPDRVLTTDAEFSCLKQAVILTPADLPVAVIDRLQQFRKAGMWIVIKESDKEDNIIPQ